ncbi:response regulator [Aquincola sp. J276]|uniref:hybrid sensor histidine kinase/response regulator n=1 Tax=Aquincola sp. J276 TaxID=2898432 RepID=UPI002150FF96|nr:response regulator [Aquincola sp. J276]MCR5867772.1 response regulator [Aquincola sp. J276]
MTSHEPVNILIVDDEPANLVVLETVLDDPGYRLVRADSPDQALLALVQEEFALLILDIRMPGMTGFELAQMIKERKKTAGVPIIFLTAYYDRDQHVLEGYGTGAVDFLNKPVNPAVLRSKVSVFVELHRQSRALSRANQELRDLNQTLEQRVAERTEALHRADRQLREMMGSITDGLLMLDREWRFTYANERGARLMGASPEELDGTCLWQPPARVSEHSAGWYRRAREEGRTLSFDEYFLEPVDKWFQCHCYPSEAGLSIYFLDVTERREVDVRRERLFAAEQAAREEVERVARAKEAFLASLSHELRTPLAAILGWTAILRRPKTDAAMLQRGIEVIARNARAQSQLVSDLLDESRIVSGKLRMNFELLDLNGVAAAAVDNARPAAQNKGVEIALQLAEAPPLEIMGDTARLHQIVSNLIANALKFTPAGGRVQVSTAQEGAVVRLQVCDTGEGIRPEFLPHVFERFSQADGSAARAHGGLGLGLSIAHSLVEQHGGRISAHSPGVGQGTLFTVEFPRARADARTAGPPPAAAVSDAEPWEAAEAAALGIDDVSLQRLRVLLVDDHADVLEVQRRFLEDRGAVVSTANSGEQALESLRQHRFDILLSDLGMPGMDGYRLIELVRGELGLGAEQLPAVAVTAFVRAEDKRNAVESGYQTVVQKPVNAVSLARTVYGLARRR